MSEPPPLAEIARTRISDGRTELDLATLRTGSCFSGDAARLAGRSVLLATESQVLAAAAMVELDGLVARLTVAPPDLKPEQIEPVLADAAVDVVVTDLPSFPGAGAELARITAAVIPLAAPLERRTATEWVLATSGTSGRPKLVAHTMAGLTGAIERTASQGQGRDGGTTWATFYDIRRYGGLQILLRALVGGSDLLLSRPGEPLVEHLHRLGAGQVTSISGTPSHWRRVLMSAARDALAPSYIRLSGEIADQAVLDGLRVAFPSASIGHAYASTEAGVGFAVDDGLEGFPAPLLSGTGSVTMKVSEGSLRVRSPRTALRYLGQEAPALADRDGFVDTGDLVEQRGDRWFFVGRRGGIINVGGAKVNPEEVERAINSHPGVRMSLVKGRRNPLVGSLVVAEVVPAVAEPAGEEALRAEILAYCRARLDAHKVPALLRFVPSLPLTAGGKLSRDEPRLA